MNQKIKNILIVKPSSLGDVVDSLPTLKALRNRFPEAQISWLVSRKYKDIVESSPYLNGVIVFEKSRKGDLKRPFSTIREFVKLIKVIRAMRFDLVVDLQGLFRSGLITFLSQAPWRIGFANAREFSPLFYNKKVPVSNMDMHGVDRYLLVAESLGAKVETKDFTIEVPEEDSRYIREFLHRHNFDRDLPLIAINSSARWPTKRWPKERFARLCDILNRQMRATVVLIGGEDDIGLIEQIRATMETVPILAAGKTSLMQLAALLREIDLLVSLDSGPMHIAAALGTPVVAIFGPTDPARTGPYGDGHIVVSTRESCSPCFKKRCRRPLCMEHLTVDEVFEAVKGLIARLK